MSARKTLLCLAALCLAAAALLPAAAAAAPAPAWALSVRPMPSNFAPGANPKPEYMVIATNVGAAQTTGEAAEVKAVLPTGLAPVAVTGKSTDPASVVQPTCEIEGQAATCKTSEPLKPDRMLLVQVTVKVTAPPGTYDLNAAVKGGGAPQTTTVFPTQVQAGPLAFGFLPGFQAPLTSEEGAAPTTAGSHPYQQTIDFAFPTVNPGDGITNAGHPLNVRVELPRGMVGNPAASRVLCTEVELTGPGCPRDSQVGVADVTTLFGVVGQNTVFTTPLYNMVPPPGTPAEFATNVAEVGIFAHVLAAVRTDGDYGIEAATHDQIAFGTQPIFGVQAQVWDDPSAEVHDGVRGQCARFGGSCPPEKIPVQKTAFLTMPGDCSGQPPRFEVRADSWEKPAPQFEEEHASYESASLTGTPAPLQECGKLKFEPTIQARPTTNLTDSPSGLDFDLHQPQSTSPDALATASVKDVKIAFPAGMTVNSAQAGGLGACSEQQIGFRGSEAGALRFSKEPQRCPNAAKVGTVEVTSPALVARNEAHEVERQEGEPVLEPLHGSLYLAQPFANPFNSLVATYVVVEDEKTGIVAKLAGKGELDPQSGQVSFSFEENPELPFEDVKAHIFGGSRGAFVTPPTCGTYTTTTDLTPWSAPEGKDAFPEASLQTAATPRGGPCPTSESQLPRAFKLNAGTESPAAGKYSPLLFKLSREDGTQRLAKIESTLPRGLLAKLAGVGICSEADIAKARSREEPNKGVLEQSDPSCPASSQVGTVTGAAGAGPTPYYTSGHAYLAGPYKGAPISIVAIVPAVAGPFDLGVVVSRIAVFLDPETAEARAVSDPLPTILDGVPLDLRSVALRADRPNFSLNPTSCDEKSFGGQAITTLSQAVPLSERFQVGGCKSLPYKPKMSVRLFGPVHRGAHPRLKAVLTAKAGEANTAAVSFTFPKSEFIDQAHFRTICTRVQFAANQCPAGSVYGHVKVISPLVDYPLEGPAYLRSSSHKLPDLVVALHGPPSQPIELDAAGRVDSVNGGLRVRFEEVPDAPFTKLIFNAQGAKKGLFQNSTNICKGTHRATLKLDSQSGKAFDSQPPLKAQCKKGKGKKQKRGGARSH
jgi:hypothetical protein